MSILVEFKVAVSTSSRADGAIMSGCKTELESDSYHFRTMKFVLVPVVQKSSCLTTPHREWVSRDSDIGATGTDQPGRDVANVLDSSV